MPLLGNYDDHGGLNRMVSLLANDLTRDYNVVVAAYGDCDEGYVLNDAVSYFQISGDSLNVEHFEDLAVIVKADITIISHNCSKQGVDMAERLTSYGKTVIAWNHEDYFLPYTNLKYREIWPGRVETQKTLAASVWLTSHSCAAYSIRAANGIVIPNFIDGHAGSKSKGSQKSAKKLVAVARFNDRRKQLSKLLECYERIIQKDSDVALTVVGPFDGTMEYTRSENITDAVKRIQHGGAKLVMAGVQDDVSSYYQESDLHILPSYGEGFGITILESAQHGVPSVVFDNSGFRDIISDGKDGVICPDGDTTEMANRIIELFHDNKKLERMKHKTSDILIKFSKGPITSQWRALLDSATKSAKISKYEVELEPSVAKSIINEYERSFSRLYYNGTDDAAFEKLYVEQVFSSERKGLEDSIQYLQKLLNDAHGSKRWIYSGYVVKLIKNVLRK